MNKKCSSHRIFTGLSRKPLFFFCALFVGTLLLIPLPAWGQAPEMPTVVLPDPGTMEGFRHRQGDLIRFEVTGSMAGRVWGTDVYTDDSRLAVAAVHAGRVSPGERAVVTVLVLPGLQAYHGSRRHGVSTSAFGRWTGSFAFVGRPGSRERVGAATPAPYRLSDPEPLAVAAQPVPAAPPPVTPAPSQRVEPASPVRPASPPTGTTQATRPAEPSGPVYWVRPNTRPGRHHILGRIPEIAIEYRALVESVLEAQGLAPTMQLNTRFREMRWEVQAEWGEKLAEYTAAHPFPENIPFEVEGLLPYTVDGVAFGAEGEAVLIAIAVTLKEPLHRRGLVPIYFVGLDSRGEVIVPSVSMTSLTVREDLPAGSSLVLSSRWGLLEGLIYLEDFVKLRIITKDVHDALTRQARNYIFNVELTSMEDLMQRG